MTDSAPSIRSIQLDRVSRLLAWRTLWFCCPLTSASVALWPAPWLRLCKLCCQGDVNQYILWIGWLGPLASYISTECPCW
jgi:hypothetical protein